MLTFGTLRTNIKKWGLVALMLLAGLFALFDQWLSPASALRAAISIPFLFFAPGFYLTKTWFPTLDRLETITLALLLSWIGTSLGIFVIEENTLRLTVLHIVLITAALNILSGMMYLARRLSFLPRLRAHIYRKFHKND